MTSAFERYVVKLEELLQYRERVRAGLVTPGFETPGLDIRTQEAEDAFRRAVTVAAADAFRVRGDL